MGPAFARRQRTAPSFAATRPDGHLHLSQNSVPATGLPRPPARCPTRGAAAGAGCQTRTGCGTTSAAGYAGQLSDELTEIIVARGAAMPSPMSPIRERAGRRCALAGVAAPAAGNGHRIVPGRLGGEQTDRVAR